MQFFCTQMHTYCMFSYPDVFKPARRRVGPFGAIFLTFVASSILHVSNGCLCVYVCPIQVCGWKL